MWILKYADGARVISLWTPLHENKALMNLVCKRQKKITKFWHISRAIYFEKEDNSG